MNSTPGTDGPLRGSWADPDTVRGDFGACWASPDIAKANMSTAATTAIRNSIERFIDLDLLYSLDFRSSLTNRRLHGVYCAYARLSAFGNSLDARSSRDDYPPCVDICSPNPKSCQWHQGAIGWHPPLGCRTHE